VPCDFVLDALRSLTSGYSIGFQVVCKAELDMKYLAFLLALPFVLVAGALLLNRAPMLSPPGPMERLKTYLTTNVAETREGHVFPELRPPIFAAQAKAAQDAVVKAMRSLGWREIQETDGEIRALVVSALFRFRDDVSVRVQATEQGTVLHARSASRVGKGDLGANARHLQALFAQVERLIGARVAGSASGPVR
jgi:uncharacterized protein (DUF1499 family)